MVVLDYPNAIDPILGYAPGTILTDDLMDYRSLRAAERVLLARYERHGYAGVHNLMALIDNCRVPEYFNGPEYEERYLASLLSQERLERAAKRHMGGGDLHEVMAFNRTTAAIITTCLALLRPGDVVPFLVPRYPKPWLKGHGHPAVPRAVSLAGGATEIVVDAEELRKIVSSTKHVGMIIVCASYRGLVSADTLIQATKIARDAEIPLFMDDASGARTRTIADGQPRAIDLGADLAVTSCEKFGLDGPRAGLMVGRRDLMELVGMKATVLGTEARPSIAAAIVRALEEFTDERGRELFGSWTKMHEPLYEAARRRLGERVTWKGYTGINLLVEDILEITMERAGIEKCLFAPVDVATALAMILLRRHGYMTVPALHYPGASKNLGIHLGQRSARNLTVDTIVQSLDDGLNTLSGVLKDRRRLEEILLGPAGLEI